MGYAAEPEVARGSAGALDAFATLSTAANSEVNKEATTKIWISSRVLHEGVGGPFWLCGRSPEGFQHLFEIVDISGCAGVAREHHAMILRSDVLIVQSLPSTVTIPDR